ncbi:nucleoside 2-deoxyribosyltransferase [Pseudoxanthomonas sp. PXM02]|uniref:nucleoside 2-deoxyribosyltransferase n=1 Tax=Pseudoxanthomonas sp. PXM02 TaxID=2769294 RepID=UPI0017822DE6|nr:nucleoside 2-deoxyribosyltransferase [Pseudoxanthomonas sp. PXM02]MBD9480620.1 nucleoside 2-deoxyribosyltransferase [Pseudoxanthomonas sp. PXM02]
MIQSLYLAGPDIFRPDAVAHGERLKALCARYGFEGLFPLDAQVAGHATGDRLETARWIYRADLGLLDAADAVLANLDFFRGAEPDSGTCFEVGYAIARGKPVYGYVPEGGSLADRIRQRCPQYLGKADGLDAGGWELEEFGLPLNLMLAVPSVIVVGDAETALRRLRADVDAQRRASLSAAAV